MELKIRDGDYVSDGIGGEKRASGTEEMLERALYRLSVRRGSFPFLPTLGSELYRLGGEKPGAREAAAKQYAAEALAEESSVSVEGAELTENGDGTALLRVLLTADGERTAVELTVGGT